MLELLSLTYIFHYVSHHFVEFYVGEGFIGDGHLLTLDIVQRVNALLSKELPLRVVVLHVLNKLRHVDETVPSVHHILNDELDEADLTF
jgi:hypothetical protein